MTNEQNQSGAMKLFIGLKALLAIGIGVAFLINPMGMVTTFSYILGAVLIVMGILNIYNGLSLKKEILYWRMLAQDGLLQLAVGIILIAWPNLTPGIIMIILGVWIILAGVIQMVIANKFDNEKGRRNFQGIIAIILGALIVFNPGQGVKIVTMIFGVLSLLYGLFMIYLLLQVAKTD